MEAPDPRGEPAAPPAVRTGDGRDAWKALSVHTAARIALGRAGGSLRTESYLGLKLAHAGARDAVGAPFDVRTLGEAFRSQGLETRTLATRTHDRMSYLVRPDLGRRLDAESSARLRAEAPAWGRRDLALIVSDGLSATAAGRHALGTVVELVRILTQAGWTHYPIFLAPFARVKLQDDVGGLLGAPHSLILLGERPGLSSHDSLGAYLTFEPRADRTDADRNCVSNIRDDGLPPLAAARILGDILQKSRRLRLSGNSLRDAG